MTRISILAMAILLLAACTDQNKKDQTKALHPDQTMYLGGDILTMAGEEPVYAEAIVAQDGKIVFVGSEEEAKKSFQYASEVNLDGRTMLPGFIDAHGHAYMSGVQSMSANLLPPPDGQVNSIPLLVEQMKAYTADGEQELMKSGWIIGFGYDDAQLAELRHPTAEELDGVSTEVPVLIIHQSGHLGVMNQKGLDMVSYSADTENPPGGVIRRTEGSNKPNGVLEEMALFGPLFQIFGKFDKETNEKIALAGLKAYASFGFTTAQEGRATKDATETWVELADKGQLMIDVVSYPDLQQEMKYMKEKGAQKSYSNHFRIGGIKLSLDGSPQGKTAWLTKPYLVPPPGKGPDYRGYGAFSDDSALEALIDTAFSYNWQVLAHCNGDAAGDQFIKAVRMAANHHGNEDRRTVMIHAQTVREDQLDAMKELQIIPSFFGMHTYYWGDWHRDETLGKERAYRISPTQSALKRDMIFTQHHDAPVALPSAIMILYSVVNRTSRSGDLIGADQRISPYLALKSITDWAAYQYFEQDSKGTIEVGKLADFVVLDKNPLKIDPKELIDLQVMETIKEGNRVYKR